MLWPRSSPGSTERYAEVRIQVREIQQLFNSFDPTPFPDRDLDERAEEFITGWAMEHPSHLPLRLLISLSQPLSPQVDVQSVGESVRHYFDYRAEALGRQLRQLLAVGRISLVVGLVCLAASIGLAHLVGRLSDSAWMNIVRESLVIGGWVAMWRPLQIFLYDWWPVQLRRSLYIRLANAEVRLSTPTIMMIPGQSEPGSVRPETLPTGTRDAPVAGSTKHAACP